jgi:hypothetical protein
VHIYLEPDSTTRTRCTSLDRIVTGRLFSVAQQEIISHFSCCVCNGCAAVVVILVSATPVMNLMVVIVTTSYWLLEPGLVHCSGGDFSLPELHLGHTQPAIRVTGGLSQD